MYEWVEVKKDVLVRVDAIEGLGRSLDGKDLIYLTANEGSLNCDVPFDRLKAFLKTQGRIMPLSSLLEAYTGEEPQTPRKAEAHRG